MKVHAWTRTMLGGWLIAVAAQYTGAEETRSWSVSTTVEPASALDCEECGDDIGLLVTCNEDGMGALASVFWLAVEPSQEGYDRTPSTEISVEVGGYRAAYPVTMTEMGMLGQVPQFQLSAVDPTVVALQAGEIARFVLADQAVQIGLRGAGQALKRLAQQCRLAISPSFAKPNPNPTEAPTAP